MPTVSTYEKTLKTHDIYDDNLDPHLHQQVLPQRLAAVDPLHDAVAARVLQGDARVLDGLAEHGHHEVAVEDVLARVHVAEGDVGVVVGVGAVAVLPV